MSPCKLFFSVFLDVIIIFIDGAHLGAMAHSIPRKMARRKSKNGRGGDGGGGGGEDALIGSTPRRNGALDATKDGIAASRKQEAEDVKMARVVIDVVVVMVVLVKRVVLMERMVVGLTVAMLGWHFGRFILAIHFVFFVVTAIHCMDS